MRAFSDGRPFLKRATLGETQQKQESGPRSPHPHTGCVLCPELPLRDLVSPPRPLFTGGTVNPRHPARPGITEVNEVSGGHTSQKWPSRGSNWRQSSSGSHPPTPSVSSSESQLGARANHTQSAALRSSWPGQEAEQKNVSSQSFKPSQVPHASGLPTGDSLCSTWALGTLLSPSECSASIASRQGTLRSPLLRALRRAA